MSASSQTTGKMTVPRNLIWCFLFSLSSLTSCEARLVIPGNVVSEYSRKGDINLGYLMRIHTGSSQDTMCRLSRPARIHDVKMAIAANWTINKINARSDLLPNVTLGFTVMDTCTRVIDLHTLARSLMFLPDDSPQGPSHETCAAREEGEGGDVSLPTHHKVVGIVGPGSSYESALLASVFSVFHIPVISTLSTSDELTDLTRYEYFLSLVPPNRVSILPLIDLVLHFEWKYIGILYSEGSFGESGYKVIEKLVEQYGICVSMTSRIPSARDDVKLERIVGDLENHSSASVIIILAEAKIMDNLFKYMVNNDRVVERIFISTEPSSTRRLEDGHPSLGIFYVTAEIAPLPEFEDYLQYEFPPLDNDLPDTWKEDMFDTQFNCTWRVFEDVDNLTAYDLREASSPHCSTLLNETFNGTDTSRTVSPSKYYDGTLVYAHALHAVIEEHCPEAFQDKSYLKDCIQGRDLLRVIRNVSMEGANGLIKFASDGDMYGTYIVWQIQPTNETYIHYKTGRVIREARKVAVGTWDQHRSEQLQLNHSEIRWKESDNFTTHVVHGMSVPESVCSQPCGPKEYKITSQDGCCWNCHRCRSTEIVMMETHRCLQCPPTTWPDEETATACLAIIPSYLSSSNPIWMALAGSTSLSSILAWSACALFIRQRHTRVVKATNFPLSMVMLTGVSIASLTVFAFLTRPSEATCSVRQWGFHLSVNLLYSPMFFKTLQIYRIFKGGKKGKTRQMFISSRWQRVFTSFMISTMIILLVCLHIVQPPHTELRMPMRSVKFVELICEQNYISFLTPITYNVFLILVSGFLGFKVRKLPANFNESGFIFISVSTTLFMWLVFLPIYFTAFYAESRTSIMALCLVLNALITLALLFGSKIYAIYFVDEIEELNTQGGSLGGSMSKGFSAKHSTQQTSMETSGSSSKNAFTTAARRITKVAPK